MNVGECLRGLPSELGFKVKDRIGGFTGIAIVIMERFDGTIHVDVRARAEKENELGVCHSFDANILEYVDDGVADIRQIPSFTDVPLGARVRDQFSGFEGVTIWKFTHINGCVEFIVEPEMGKESIEATKGKAKGIEHSRLKVLKASMFDKIKPAAVPKPVKTTEYKAPPGCAAIKGGSASLKF